MHADISAPTPINRRDGHTADQKGGQVVDEGGLVQARIVAAGACRHLAWGVWASREVSFDMLKGRGGGERQRERQREREKERQRER